MRRTFGSRRQAALVRSSHHADEQSAKYVGDEHLNRAPTLANA